MSRALLPLGLLLVLLAGVAAEEEWEALTTKTVTFTGPECEHFVLSTPKRDAMRITFNVSGMAAACDPGTDITLTETGVHHGECIQLGTSGSCEVPGRNGVKTGQELCNSFDNAYLYTVPFSGEFDDPNVMVEEETYCWDSTDYFYAIKSTCAVGGTVTVTVEARELSTEEEEMCDALEEFAKGLAMAFGLMMFLAIGLPTIAVIIGIMICCFCCPGCPGYNCCHPKPNPQPVQVVTVPQQYPPSYPAQNSQPQYPPPVVPPYGKTY